jgi:hypothetical protein
LLDRARSLDRERDAEAIRFVQADSTGLWDTRACWPRTRLFFTIHDRCTTTATEELWRIEAERWARGEQDPRLVEFGDHYFTEETGCTFMHLPNRAEILADLDVTGREYIFDAMLQEIAAESEAARAFSDECWFWTVQARVHGSAVPPAR